LNFYLIFKKSQCLQWKWKRIETTKTGGRGRGASQDKIKLIKQIPFRRKRRKQKLRECQENANLDEANLLITGIQGYSKLFIK
jgi:hypothetical protein